MAAPGLADYALDGFDFFPGKLLSGKYEVRSHIASRWDGEVYRIREIETGIERAAKFFYPEENARNRLAAWHARKLHRLRHCPVVTQYYTQETITFSADPVTYLVSEYVEGELLRDFVDRQPGQRLTVFQGLHLLHSLTRGIELIHDARDYHGDIHLDNIMVRQVGLGFDLKLLDLYNVERSRTEGMSEDVCDLARMLYEILGGRRCYAKQPLLVKSICCGLKNSLIRSKFRTARQLREHLESLTWE